jgi:hypothetical protein
VDLITRSTNDMLCLGRLFSGVWIFTPGITTVIAAGSGAMDTIVDR